MDRIQGGHGNYHTRGGLPLQVSNLDRITRGSRISISIAGLDYPRAQQKSQYSYNFIVTKTWKHFSMSVTNIKTNFFY